MRDADDFPTERHSSRAGSGSGGPDERSPEALRRVDATCADVLAVLARLDDVVAEGSDVAALSRAGRLWRRYVAALAFGALMADADLRGFDDLRNDPEALEQARTDVMVRLARHPALVFAGEEKVLGAAREAGAIYQAIVTSEWPEGQRLAEDVTRFGRLALMHQRGEPSDPPVDVSLIDEIGRGLLETLHAGMAAARR